jgi:carotenoid cleavage dioxygenase
MVHDFIVTQNWVVFPVFPATASLERAIKGGPPIAWDESISSRFGFLRRTDSIDKIRWVETDPCFVYHPMNAFEEGDRLIADLIRYDAAPGFPTPDGGRTDAAKAVGRLERWTFDLAGGSDDPKVEVLDDLASEFPRIDDRSAGLPYRHGFMASTEGPEGKNALFDQVVHVDFETGKVGRWHAGRESFVGEPIFVPRAADADEGDGFLLSIVYLGAENRSDLVLFDARDVESGPRARARLDLRVPHGFHGNWIPG